MLAALLPTHLMVVIHGTSRTRSHQPAPMLAALLPTHLMVVISWLVSWHFVTKHSLIRWLEHDQNQKVFCSHSPPEFDCLSMLKSLLSGPTWRNRGRRLRGHMQYQDQLSKTTQREVTYAAEFSEQVACYKQLLTACQWLQSTCDSHTFSLISLAIAWVSQA